ncbi:hypothetical protein [Microbulbifer taiwanensis]|uniref:hypothetical protein n=1 Tax=Microbulbifer taiwanensis TaxID=986746 RepID=UPI0036117C20
MKKLFATLTTLVLVLFAGWKWLLLPGVERSMNRHSGPEYPPLSAEAAALHQSLLVGDLHADSFLWARDLQNEADYGHVDLPRARRGNLAMQVFTAVTKSPAARTTSRIPARPVTISPCWRWPRPGRRAPGTACSSGPSTMPNG